MSLFDFDMQPIATLVRRPVPGLSDELGLPLGDTVLAGSGIKGRLTPPSTSQRAMWMSLGIVASYQFITYQSDIQNGDLLIVDERTFRVVGTGGKTYAYSDTIPSYYEYPLEEIRRE